MDWLLQDFAIWISSNAHQTNIHLMWRTMWTQLQVVWNGGVNGDCRLNHNWYDCFYEVFPWSNSSEYKHIHFISIINQPSWCSRVECCRGYNMENTISSVLFWLPKYPLAMLPAGLHVTVLDLLIVLELTFAISIRHFISITNSIIPVDKLLFILK